MYQAKQRAESGFRFFTEAMNQQVHRQLRMKADLRAALKHNQFTLAYQPRVDVHSGRVIAVEALLRWRHPERGLLSASELLDMVEGIGPINTVGAWDVSRGYSDMCHIRQV